MVVIIRGWVIINRYTVVENNTKDPIPIDDDPPSNNDNHSDNDQILDENNGNSNSLEDDRVGLSILILSGIAVLCGIVWAVFVLVRPIDRPIKKEEQEWEE
jgi:hypothetical protein